MEPVQPMSDIRPAPRRAARRGFTLLEILVVIGIILLLVAIGVIAFGALDQSGKVTKTTLANMQAMLAEFQSTTDLREQPQQVYVGDAPQPPNPNGNPRVDLWFNPVDLTGRTEALVTSGQALRYDWGAVANTQTVLRYFNRIPANKQVMTRLPSKQVHGQADGAKGAKLTPAGDPRLIDPPLILDAWGNPILVVGKAGIAGVKFEGDTKDFRVTTSGPSTGSVDLVNPPKNWRPFFASAGPDGDFKTGDDNLYSFDPQ